MLIAIRFTVLMLVICGFLYPLALTGLGQALFPAQANGSLLFDPQGHLIGSKLIGQSFTQPKYFHLRPAVNSYDASNSGGSNLGATSKKLIDRVQQDATAYAQENAVNMSIPVDAVTASASSLDPHISLANAIRQLPRVANARHLPIATVKQWLDQMTEKPVLAERSYVNVLRLNVLLDQQQSGSRNAKLGS
jgi:K+-transporting ATPase ATPase C chain